MIDQRLRVPGLARALSYSLRFAMALLVLIACAAPTMAGEADLVIPPLDSVKFMGIDGKTLLYSGLVVSVIGLAFGLWIFSQLKNMPVHQSMREVSELIYETCKTYLLTQGKFLAVLWVFI